MDDNTPLKGIDGRLLYSKDGTPITAKLYGDPIENVGKLDQDMIDRQIARINKIQEGNKNT